MAKYGLRIWGFGDYIRNAHVAQKRRLQSHGTFCLGKLVSTGFNAQSMDGVNDLWRESSRLCASHCDGHSRRLHIWKIWRISPIYDAAFSRMAHLRKVNRCICALDAHAISMPEYWNIPLGESALAAEEPSVFARNRRMGHDSRCLLRRFSASCAAERCRPVLA